MLCMAAHPDDGVDVVELLDYDDGIVEVVVI